MKRPFFILGLPRSRTYWLSKFLTYREWRCGHEEVRHIRSIDDAKAWLSQPFTGSAETALAPFWRLIPRDARVVVVRRPVAEVRDSLLRVSLGDGGGFDPKALDALLIRADAKLRQVAARWPNALEVGFSDLKHESVCARVFEHCLPYEFDKEWWLRFRRANLQCDMVELMRYCQAYAPQMSKVAAIAKQVMLREISSRRNAPSDGMTYAREGFETFYRDAQHLFAEHLCAVGEAPDAFAGKNLSLLRTLDGAGLLHIVTARSNGRMFGYLMTELSPSREAEDRISAVHTTFYASLDAPGTGMKLEREACRMLKEIGVYEVFGRAGDRGDGPRLGAMYRRAGFDLDGHLYRRVF